MKKILVLGASKNLGKYLFNKFKSDGHKTIGLSRKKSKKRDFIKCDLSSDLEASNMLKNLKKNYKKIDIIIFSVGHSSYSEQISKIKNIEIPM